jgi:hypothetical protein
VGALVWEALVPGLLPSSEGRTFEGLPHTLLKTYTNRKTTDCHCDQGLSGPCLKQLADKAHLPDSETLLITALTVVIPPAAGVTLGKPDLLQPVEETLILV